MKYEVFYGKGMGKVKKEYPEIYEVIKKLNEVVYTGKVLDYKTQKLIAIAITASHCDETATEKQMRSAMKELKITPEEIADVLRVVLLLSGQPAFTKGMRILDEITKK
ncbi:MAG: carboxymuconolactone decarboxylase family protein [Candidatus Methanofastidiosum sp.]|nr:carboxymuconolactone decarboxylase family protein [Methanofastidiosum sp.]NYT13674.1 carboxymuconolactone decarboxylase family protein [Candidatus Methanofastidiosa archaeon]